MPESKYRAPALEKGLDILELLSRQKRPLLISQMASLLERSVSEIFRMAMVLVERGYLEPAEGADALVLTNKLFLLGMGTAPNQNLVAKAIPLMNNLAKKTQEACHLVVTADDQIIVIVRVEAPGDLGYSVRVGHVRPLTVSNSGIVLFAFEAEKTRDKWRERLIRTVSPEDWSAFEASAAEARREGVMVRQSSFVKSVTDISCPVFSAHGIVAALTMPYLETRLSANINDCIQFVKDAARDLSHELGG